MTVLKKKKKTCVLSCDRAKEDIKRKRVEDSTFLWNELDWLAEMAQKSGE